MRFVGTTTQSNDWKSQINLASIVAGRRFEYFGIWAHLTLAGDLTLIDLGRKFAQSVRNGWGKSVTKYGGAAATVFALLKKPYGEVFNPPPSHTHTSGAREKNNQMPKK